MHMHKYRNTLCLSMYSSIDKWVNFVIWILYTMLLFNTDEQIPAQILASSPFWVYVHELNRAHVVILCSIL